MTENEATRELKSIKSFMKNHGRTTGCDFLEIEYEALNMAIKALEEIQQYREIAKNKHIGKDNMVISSSDLMTILNSDEKEIRNKAIDEFAEKLKYELNGNIIPDKEKFTYARKQQEQICHQNLTLKRAIKYVDYIAEQLKKEGAV